MCNNNKLYKVLAKSAVAIATFATVFAIFSRFKKRKSDISNITDADDSTTDNFDDFDFADIGKDSPRQYVSIRINERIANTKSDNSISDDNKASAH